MAYTDFKFPQKLEIILHRLHRIYGKNNQEVLNSIIANKYTIDFAVEHDNWNGGMDWHDVRFHLPEELYDKIIDNEDEITKQLASDIEKHNKLENELVGKVILECDDNYDPNWRTDSIIISSIPNNSLERIWGECNFRVFLSHKSEEKVNTTRLKVALASFGISAFVAHEDIEPTEEWQKEIESALFSMDAFVALLTIDYHNSLWTDQEVGVAIGRGVPWMAIRLGADPYGLMGMKQGVNGCNWDDVNIIAKTIFTILLKKLPSDPRLIDCAINRYKQSQSFYESEIIIRDYLTKLENLSRTQVKHILIAYKENGQNKCSWDGSTLLHPLLEKWSGEKFDLSNSEIVISQERIDNFESGNYIEPSVHDSINSDIPF